LVQVLALARATRFARLAQPGSRVSGALGAGVLAAIVTLALSVSGSGASHRVAPRSAPPAAAAPGREAVDAAALPRELAGVREIWRERMPAWRTLTGRLLSPPTLDLARAVRTANRLSAELQPSLARLEEALERRLARGPDLDDRPVDELAGLMDAAAAACVYRLRLDHAGKLGDIARRLIAAGADGMLGIPALAVEAHALSYDAAHRASVVRFLRLAAALLGRASDSPARGHVPAALRTVHWVAEAMRLTRFAGPGQMELEAFARMAFRRAGRAAGTEAGDRVGRAAQGFWDLGSGSDARHRRRAAALLRELGCPVPGSH
jgi:hypothetical protein